MKEKEGTTEISVKTHPWNSPKKRRVLQVVPSHEYGQTETNTELVGRRISRQWWKCAVHTGPISRHIAKCFCGCRRPV